MAKRLTNRFFLLFILICLVSISNAQVSLKLSPLLHAQASRGDDKQPIRLMVRDRSLPTLLSKYRNYKVKDFDSVSFHIIYVSLNELVNNILPLKEVLFAESGSRTANEELMINNLDLAVNLISTTHNKYPQWNGNGITFSLKENKPDTNDIDFKGRYLSTPLASKIVSQHATTMGTMVAGGGNSWYLGKGAAWASIITSSDFANLLPDPTNLMQQYNISLQNHSYGVGVENFYGADAGLYDAASLNTSLLHVFSSGNVGTVAATTGTYAGLAGFANVTGSFKMAKNIITVGATDSFNNVVALSSKGPAHDGRVKPEMVAFGIDGSSGAAALTSGVALMMQQAYKSSFVQLPPNAMLKAILLNSADDRGPKEVDYANGYGSLNALLALRTLSASRYFTGNVTNGGAQTFSISVPQGVKKLKATLVWNDPPAAPNAAKALINDLDLEVLNITTAEKWLPWVLNKFPHADSLRLPAVRKRDSLNNVEQVTIENPVGGNYQLTVKGYNVNASTQSFHIAYQFDSSNVFEWHFPLSADPVFPATINVLRWRSSFANATGKLDYSTSNGATWQTVNAAVNLSAGYYNWSSPAFSGKAILRMQVNNTEFVSDTFVMAARTSTGIGFNCPDSFLFYWNKIPEASAYRIYTMGNTQLTPLFTTFSDSFRVFKKSVFPSKYYAAAPLFNDREGVKSYTLDYTIQGVECYIRSFLASLNTNNVADLRLSLGSIYGISKITLEKKIGDQFVTLDTRLNISSLDLNFSDNALTQGINSYRVRIDLIGGGVVYTSLESIFYFDAKDYVVYPNPALQSGQINIAQLNIDDAIMQVFNSLGVKVYEARLINQVNSIPAHRLSKGVHFIRMISNGKRDKSFKLVVL